MVECIGHKLGLFSRLGVHYKATEVFPSLSKEPRRALSWGHLAFPWSQEQVNRSLLAKVCVQEGKSTEVQ